MVKFSRVLLLPTAAIAASMCSPKFEGLLFSSFSAGGASGSIEVTYPNRNPMFAEIDVNLDLSGLELDEIKDTHPECDYTSPLKFKWHLHVKWENNNDDSGFLDDCSADITGGHYDPTFACGGASQYKDNHICTTGRPAYACTPETFETNGINCEMGDFSGKFGELEVGEDKKIVKKFRDFFFPAQSLYDKPMYLEPNLKWNFILHLSCPEEKNPRVLCARTALALP